MKNQRDILVIDDEPVITRAVSRICAEEGLTVDAADSGSAALDMLNVRSYRLILCDIMMTDLDGFAFLKEAARRELRIPVVMATGYATLENAVRSLTEGAADFIAKPFTADELLAVVRRALRARRLQEQAAAGPRDSLAFVPCPPRYYRLGNVSWVKEEREGTALIGLSDLFLKTIDGVAGLELSPLNDEAAQGAPCATVTSAAGDRHCVPCPVGGRIVEVNAAAKADPASLEKDPYFEGWLYRVVPTDLQGDLKSLVSCSSDRL
ncbi:MAG: response regulator [Elusimicrobia bacterium]|nr:response regulator [Elusimicrobiota bacterium]